VATDGATSAYLKLPLSGRQFVGVIIDSLREALGDYAGLMERGEIPMLSGPDAVREFADSLSTVRDILEYTIAGRPVTSNETEG